MQLFGWPSCWVLMTVIAVSSCLSLEHTSTEIREMEEQPWTWNGWDARKVAAASTATNIEDDEDMPSRPADDDIDQPLRYAKRSQSSLGRRRPKQQQEPTLPDDDVTPVELDEQQPIQDAVDVESPRVLPLLGSQAALSKLTRQKDAVLRKILRQAARRQSMKRSPSCMRKCIAQGLLHPAQCHSLC